MELLFTDLKKGLINFKTDYGYLKVGIRSNKVAFVFVDTLTDWNNLQFERHIREDLTKAGFEINTDLNVYYDVDYSSYKELQ